jgi:site-specific DNA recombinase
LQRARGDLWLPQELQARQEQVRRGLNSLTQQRDRLTEAYLAGVIELPEYQRRREELERRCQGLASQDQLFITQAKQDKELKGMANSLENFCQRVPAG